MHGQVPGARGFVLDALEDGPALRVPDRHGSSTLAQTMRGPDRGLSPVCSSLVTPMPREPVARRPAVAAPTTLVTNRPPRPAVPRTGVAGTGADSLSAHCSKQYSASAWSHVVPPDAVHELLVAELVPLSPD